MSLVNQMLQDLQQRKAADSTPLSGLRAVPGNVKRIQPEHTQRWWIAAASVTAVTAVIAFWLRTGADAEDRPQQASTTIFENQRQQSVQPEPGVNDVMEPGVQIEYPLFASLETNRLDYHMKSPLSTRLETNRLDYHLKSPPQLLSPLSANGKRKPVATSAPKETVVPKVVSDDTSDAAVKKAIAPAILLRRDGLAALRAGRAAAAERYFSQLVVADPVNPEARLFLHAALKAQSRDGEARAALRNGLNDTSDPSQLAKVLAHELLAEGLVDNALTLLTTHRPVNGGDLDYKAMLAAVNQRAGNHAVATELYELLVARQPANGDWWVGLAISQEAQGQVSEATKSFTTAAAAGTLDLRLARYAAERLERLEQGS